MWWPSQGSGQSTQAKHRLLATNKDGADDCRVYIARTKNVETVVVTAPKCLLLQEITVPEVIEHRWREAQH